MAKIKKVKIRMGKKLYNISAIADRIDRHHKKLIKDLVPNVKEDIESYCDFNFDDGNDKKYKDLAESVQHSVDYHMELLHEEYIETYDEIMSDIWEVFHSLVESKEHFDRCFEKFQPKRGRK